MVLDADSYNPNSNPKHRIMDVKNVIDVTENHLDNTALVVIKRHSFGSPFCHSLSVHTDFSSVPLHLSLKA